MNMADVAPVRAAAALRNNLGIYAKSSAISSRPNASKPAKPSKTAIRTESFRMQRAGQRALNDVRFERKSKEGTKESRPRILGCHRNVKDRPTNPGVDVRINKATGRAGFGNVMTCGSPWVCPICAAKITEHRREELQTASATHAGRSGRLVMMTLTFRHDRTMSLDESLQGFYAARDKFFGYRAFKSAMKEVGAIGRVFSTESTYGENGWHPHLHILIFVGSGKAETTVLNELEGLRDYWGKAVAKSGLGQINEHGFDIQNGDFAAEYIAKFGHQPQVMGWTTSHELTKSHLKVGKTGSLTPFDFLRIISTGRTVEIGDRVITAAIAEDLFREFAIRFHGKRQLIWSKGLRELLGMNQEKSDEEIAADADEIEVAYTIPVEGDGWRDVLRNNCRGELLEVAERVNAEYGFKAVGRAIQALLAYMRTREEVDEPWFDIVRQLRW